MQYQRINWHIKGLIKIADLAYKSDNMSQSANDKYKILCFWDKHGLQATIDAFEVKKRTLYHCEFNDKMSDYLFCYNAKRAHDALEQISPIEYLKMNEKKYREKCNMLWVHTLSCSLLKITV